ncbi:hypothetical protein F4780DRAFT_773515 [Xylariomycetidae sp. FL0641]|nr:hypothetical protein F4780DRAFT_773515 [Xylariomycetidae sp. FL0641]
MTKNELPDTQPRADDAPPQYSTTAATGAQPSGPVDELNSAFATLNLSTADAPLDVDPCLAHLKLLYAFQTLKDDIGYTDGLWQLFDTRAASNLADKDPNLKNETTKELAMIREKRWALFIARAVDRYESWWNSFPAFPLTESDLHSHGPQHSGFPTETPPLPWTDLTNSPHDVLLVWHAHMLNPQAYLEDCIRQGYNGLWAAGMPWKFVNDAIDDRFNYRVSADCQAAWQALTGRAWDNREDSPTKTLKCPACSEKLVIPWTTCGLPEDAKIPAPDFAGEGYGDARLQFTCHQCGTTLTREVLEVGKFIRDVRNLLAHHRPMPGTILDYKTGLPTTVRGITAGITTDRLGRTFPNRLIKKSLRSSVLEILEPNQYLAPSMNTVRALVEDAIKDQGTLKMVDGISGRSALKPYRLGQEARVHVRKMMSRYWDNFSPFALDLSGAVFRQGIFVEKMYKIDWLRSPVARDTMARLITKYERFTKLMALHPTHVVVPTLDVDLAWHTHQLSPQQYYAHMYRKTSRFIDHDDKIDEDKLSNAFEWTSKAYQSEFGEVYSECTCWYCEAVRASHVTSTAKILGLSKSEKISDSFHDSGRAALCPPDNSAHISAHNAVRLKDADARRNDVHRRLHLAHQARLDDNYAKAQKRARKKGRDLPPKDEYAGYYWGYPYLLYAPYIYPAYVCPVYACDPGVVASGSGGAGACAAGTCAGGAAAGACGGAGVGGCGGSGGCGGGNVGGGCGASSGPGCGGGGGAGCGGGGGGGGGCGGGGGGGGGCGGGGGGG